MADGWTRRQVLAQATIAAAVYTLDPHELCCGVNAYAQTAGSESFELKKVGDGVWAAVAAARYKVNSNAAVIETIRRNGHEACYIRPVVMRGAGPLGVEGRKNPVETFIFTMEWGRYLGAEAIENGVDVHVSSWRRIAPDTFASLAATAIERAQLAEEAQQARVIKATEDLQNALLNSISHDLRTPLVSITGALSSLQEDRGELDEETREALIENAREETERLNRLVGSRHRHELQHARAADIARRDGLTAERRQRAIDLDLRACSFRRGDCDGGSDDGGDGQSRHQS